MNKAIMLIRSRKAIRRKERQIDQYIKTMMLVNNIVVSEAKTISTIAQRNNYCRSLISHGLESSDLASRASKVKI